MRPGPLDRGALLVRVTYPAPLDVDRGRAAGQRKVLHYATVCIQLCIQPTCDPSPNSVSMTSAPPWTTGRIWCRWTSSVTVVTRPAWT